VAIYKMLQGMAFDDQDLKAMTTAYETILSELGLTERTDPLTEIVARKIITYCQIDGCDPEALRDRVLKDIRG
jgi:hypothetical protein